MTADPFDIARSGFDQIVDHYGQLLLITPTEHVFGLKTAYSTPEKPTTDAIDADVVVLTGDEAQTEYTGMRIFQGPLIMSLKRAAKFNEKYPSGDPQTGRPKMILGRLDRGEDKTGKLTEALYFTAADKRAWILVPPSEDDKKLAREFLAKKPADDPFEI